MSETNDKITAATESCAPLPGSAFVRCTHPDHIEEHDCLDRAVGCSKHCLCCMGELAIPLPTSVMDKINDACAAAGFDPHQPNDQGEAQPPAIKGVVRRLLQNNLDI